jgi:DNA-binding winged helix-turn-helix (wHTH) protein
MSDKIKYFYEFDEFRLDAENRSLWRGDELVQIFPKALEILVLLVEKKGGVVSRQELLENVWQNTFVEEANITYTVSQLRKTLGNKNYIQTVPKRGYRFTAPVKISGNGQPKFFTNAPITENEEAEKNLPASLPHLRLSTASLVWFGIGVISLLVFGFAVDKFLPKLGNKTSAPTETVRFQKLTFTGDIFYQVLAPDGKSFAYTRDGGIFLQEIGSERAVRVEVEDEKIFGFLQFSADGNSIYFRNRRTIDLAGNVLEV